MSTVIPPSFPPQRRDGAIPSETSHNVAGPRFPEAQAGAAAQGVRQLGPAGLEPLAGHHAHHTASADGLADTLYAPSASAARMFEGSSLRTAGPVGTHRDAPRTAGAGPHAALAEPGPWPGSEPPVRVSAELRAAPLARPAVRPVPPTPAPPRGALAAQWPAKATPTPAAGRPASASPAPAATAAPAEAEPLDSAITYFPQSPDDEAEPAAAAEAEFVFDPGDQTAPAPEEAPAWPGLARPEESNLTEPPAIVPPEPAPLAAQGDGPASATPPPPGFFGDQPAAPNPFLEADPFPAADQAQPAAPPLFAAPIPPAAPEEPAGPLEPAALEEPVMAPPAGQVIDAPALPPAEEAPALAPWLDSPGFGASAPASAPAEDIAPTAFTPDPSVPSAPAPAASAPVAPPEFQNLPRSVLAEPVAPAAPAQAAAAQAGRTNPWTAVLWIVTLAAWIGTVVAQIYWSPADVSSTWADDVCTYLPMIGSFGLIGALMMNAFGWWRRRR
ncbi:MAG: hypothetical protein LBM66_02245 [Bifidobacteriaceae bacterium]|jgi:hypothetical protein|nr:hypothetical protein [Bifidobacteriaceae bacterium]